MTTNSLVLAAASAEDMLTAKPLTSVAVKTFTAQSPNYAMPPNVAINPYQPPQDDSLANYSRSTDGQWQIPLQVDRTDPLIKLLVLGPEQPTIVEIAIFVEGEPFTASREKLIDNLLDHATVESLVREAVSVPVPSDTEELSLEEENVDNEKETESEILAAETDLEESPEEAAPDSEKKAPEADDANKEPEIPVVEVKMRQARTVAQRLVNYMASSEVRADREEVRWLLAEWTGGPALLTLGPAISWQRVGFAPLWNALDVNEDQNLDSMEIAAAAERLGQADVDENSIVEIEELFVLKPRSTTAPHSYPLVMVLDHDTDWRQLQSHLQAAYGRRANKQQGSAAVPAPALLQRITAGDPTLMPDELESLLDQAADIKLRVTLGGKDNLVSLLSAEPEDFSADEQTLTVVRGAEYFEFSASEQKEEAAESTATQIAVGAVIDGYPLFRLVDRNGDRRLSPRERRNLPKAFAALDLNGDGQITENEKPTAIRLAVTRGPYVHQVLANSTSAHRELTTSHQVSPSKSGVAVPSWFTDMDRNRDGDLSRSEFLGTTEQFKQLDVDGDGLVGSQEATK